MLYLSRLIHAQIVDPDGVRLGTVGDVAVDLRDPLPRVTGLCMRTDRSRVALIPRDAVESLASQQVRLRVARRFLQPRPLQPDEMLLGDILDTQVVDTDGLKVVRVNDLQLSHANGEVRLVAADVGTLGLLRRLSLDRVVQRLGRLVGRALPGQGIPRKMVATFSGPVPPGRLGLSPERPRQDPPAAPGQP